MFNKREIFLYLLNKSIFGENVDISLTKLASSVSLIELLYEDRCKFPLVLIYFGRSHEAFILDKYFKGASHTIDLIIKWKEKGLVDMRYI